MTDKSTLRKQALSQRNALSEEELGLLNQKLLAAFKTFDFSTISSIHIFLPIVVKKEPNTFLMIAWLQQNHPEITIVVPKADFTTNLMSNHVFTKKEDLMNNHYQMPEPKDGLAAFN